VIYIMLHTHATMSQISHKTNEARSSNLWINPCWTKNIKSLLDLVTLALWNVNFMWHVALLINYIYRWLIGCWQMLRKPATKSTVPQNKPTHLQPWTNVRCCDRTFDHFYLNVQRSSIEPILSILRFMACLAQV
jgi:hypothetical protein